MFRLKRNEGPGIFAVKPCDKACPRFMSITCTYRMYRSTTFCRSQSVAFYLSDYSIMVVDLVSICSDRIYVCAASSMSLFCRA